MSVVSHSQSAALAGPRTGVEIGAEPALAAVSEHAGAQPESSCATPPRPRSTLGHPWLVGALATGAGVGLFIGYGPGAEAVVAAGLAAVLVVLAAFDVEQRRIPNRIVLPATGIALVAQATVLPGRFTAFALAALAAAVAFLLPHLLNSRLMGMGDVKLVLLMGAGLGWGVFGAIFIAFVAAFPFALASLIRNGASGRGATLPFGPFLAFGALVILILPTMIGVGAS